MLHNDILSFIEKNGLTTTKQLERALFIDEITIMIIIKKLIAANKIKNINEENNCCSSRQNCSGCSSLIKRDYYIVN